MKDEVVKEQIVLMETKDANKKKRANDKLDEKTINVKKQVIKKEELDIISSIESNSTINETLKIGKEDNKPLNELETPISLPLDEEKIFIDKVEELKQEEENIDLDFVKYEQELNEYIKKIDLSLIDNLKLPYSLEGLLKNFRAMFTVILYNHGIGSVFNFATCQKAVEDISRRSFDLVQLERMNYLFPKLFKFEPIETLIHQKVIYSYIIKVPSLNIGSQKKENTIIFPADKVDVLSRLLHLKLLFYVKKEHNEYLKNINIPVEDGLPKQWYIEFDLDQIENIPIKSLPARKTINRTLPPIKAKLSFTDRTRNMFSSVKSNNNNNKLSIYDKMYQKFKQNTMEKKQTTDSDETKSKGTALDEANKRSKAAYERNRLEIERIRKEFEAELSQKKEEKKKLKVSQEKQQEYEKIMVKISQLPDIIQSIRVIFILKQGLRSLELDEVVGKINTKQQWKLSFQEVKDRIYLVQEVIPQFLNVNWNQQLKKYFVNINQLKISKEEVDNALEKYLEGKKKSEE